jgi:hypothetical protein
MKESKEASAGSAPSDRGAQAGNEGTTQDKAWPSRAERLERIRAYQAQALERSDPHAANLELLDGDVMLLALSVKQSMEKGLIEGTPTPESSRRLGQQAEMFFRCMSQIGRNAAIIRQLSQLAKEAPGAES